MKKNFLSVLIAICMVLTLMPMTALAVFTDTEGHWAKDSIDRWAAVGVLNGKSADSFDPNGNMTRAEFAQMLCNLMGYTKKAGNTFTDVPDDAWYADAILKLAAAGVINGVGDNMAAPNVPITREQAAVMLCRAFNIRTGSAAMGFADAGSVSSWASDAVATLADMGMLNGVGDNQVAPKLNINRASVAKLIDNMVAEYVTESKTITGEVSGIIVVAADADVVIEDAALTAPVIVAPKAEGADVALTGTTAAENVVVAAGKATVTVGKDASAEEVTAAADKTEVKVEGTVSTVAVEGEGAKVDVAGSVGTVSTEAANTTVAVSGTVEKVEIAEGADKTNVTTASTAKIESVTTAAEDVRVSGTGTVGTVTAEAGSADVTTKDTVVRNEGAGKVNAGSKPVEVGTEEVVKPTTGGSVGGGGGGSTATPADVVKAPIHDNVASNAIADENLGTVSVAGTVKKAATESTPAEYDVKITGTNIVKHNNTNQTEGHWVGFGMPAAPEGETYSYYVDDAGTATASIASRTTPDGKYNTVYFSYDTEAAFNAATRKITVKDSSNAVVAIYNVSFKVTFWKATATIENDMIAGDKAVYGKYLIGPDGEVGGSAAVSGLNMTITGEIDVAKLNKNSGAEDPKEYTYYWFKLGNNTAGLIDSVLCGGQPWSSSALGEITVATRIYDDTNKALLKTTHEYQLKDAAGRVQDTVTLTVDATGARVKGMNKVVFKDGNAIAATLNGAKDSEVTAPAVPASTEDVYYTGKWKPATGEAINAGAKVTVTEAAEVVYTAEKFDITETELYIRVNGPKDEIETFDYRGAYEAAGLGFDEDTSTVTVDVAKLVKLATSADPADGAKLSNIKGHGNPKSKDVVIGIAYKTEEGATQVGFGSSTSDLATAPMRDLATHPSCYNNTLISYIPVATIDDGVLTCKADGVADSDYCIWKNESGAVVAVTRTVINIETTFDTNEGTAGVLMVKKGTDNKAGEGDEAVGDIRTVGDKTYVCFEIEGLQVAMDTVKAVAFKDGETLVMYTPVKQTGGLTYPENTKEYIINEKAAGSTAHDLGWTLIANKSTGAVDAETWYFWTDSGVLEVTFSYTLSAD